MLRQFFLLSCTFLGKKKKGVKSVETSYIPFTQVAIQSILDSPKITSQKHVHERKLKAQVKEKSWDLIRVQSHRREPNAD